MKDKVLEEAGLTKNEIIVYKTLLKLGSSTAGAVTKKSGIHRSRVYESLNRLIDKGLVGYSIKANIKHFYAQNPEALVEFIDEKRRKVKKIMPELKALQSFEPEKQEANVFEGYKGLKSVFDNILNKLNKGDEILVFGARSGQDVAAETWSAYFKNFQKRRVKKGIKFKIIFNEDLRESKFVKDFNKFNLTEIRFIDQITPAGVNIHRDNVGIILWKKKPYAFLITSKDVSKSFREYFKVLWKQAKS